MKGATATSDSDMTDRTPDPQRLHIVLLGERNSGKSSLLNAIAGQKAAIVSDVPGTTTDCVSKPIEIPGLGPCVLVDTAGLDDCGELGLKRVQSTLEALRSADIVLVVADALTGRMPDVPDCSASVVIPVVNKAGDSTETSTLETAMKKRFGKEAVRVNALNGEGIPALISAIQENIPEDWDTPLLTAGVAREGDLVLLVMPQDSEAPKGRLILPQQQTIRELLDRHCRVVCCQPSGLQDTLASLKDTPTAIIADSQVLAQIGPLKPEGCTLTSFSILLAAAKGDITYFKKSAEAIDRLREDSRVLIAEACTHVPASEDIGRVKIPALLRQRAGNGLRVDVVSGRDFPVDLRPYDLVIHCGACMFNRRYVLSRVEQARKQGVPMTNYGVTIAYIKNLL